MARPFNLPCRAVLLAGLACSASLSAQPSPLLDLAVLEQTSSVTRVLGAAGQGRFGGFGLPVAGGLDMDGDGYSDAAVAYMTASPLDREQAGEVYLLFGTGRLGESVDLAQPQLDVLRIVGSQRRETTGDEIWMADVTGDGLGDLIIGRQNFSQQGRPGAGALSIVAGGPQLRLMAQGQQLLDLSNPPQSATVLTLVGAIGESRLGIWMRSGEIDGDGISDLIVGADQERSTAIHQGAVYLVRGGPHLATTAMVDLSGLGATSLIGNLARIAPPSDSGEFHFGATCQLADLDGNGRAEILAAATVNRAGAVIGPDANNAHANSGVPGGRLFIAWDDNIPAPPWPAGYQFSLDAAPGAVSVISGGPSNRNFGEEIVGGADFDGDGEADLFVGDLIGDGTGGERPASGLGYVFYQAALLKNLEFRVDQAPDELVITRILGPRIGAIGADTAAVGDFDGDGRPDLLSGSPDDNPQGRSDAGTIHVLFGQDSPWPELIDTAPGQLPPKGQVRIAEIHGARGAAANDRGDVLCYSAAVGDIDGDGRQDIISNEMVGNGSTADAVDVGNLLIISGRALLPPRPIRNRPLRVRPPR